MYLISFLYFGMDSIKYIVKPLIEFDTILYAEYYKVDTMERVGDDSYATCKTCERVIIHVLEEHVNEVINLLSAKQTIKNIIKYKL